MLPELRAQPELRVIPAHKATLVLLARKAKLVLPAHKAILVRLAQSAEAVVVAAVVATTTSSK